MTNPEAAAERNNLVDIFRIVCAVMVVAIHTQPLYDANDTLGYIATQIIPRIATPFFFCVSGYFYIKSILAKKNVFLKTIKRLLMVYSIWSLLYFTIDFLNRVVIHHESIITFIKNTVLSFFIFGSCYQLWFFPALFFSIIMVTLFHKLQLVKLLAYATIPLFLLGLLGCSYYNIGNQIPIISQLIQSSIFTLLRRVVFMGLPFFMLGYFLNVFEERFRKISNRKLGVGWLAATVLFILEIIFVVALDLQENIFITLFLYPLLALTMVLLLKNPLPEKKVLATKLRGIANFIFYSHPLCIMALSKIENEKSEVSITSTTLFLLTSALTILVGWIFVRVNNKWLNKTFL